MYTVLLTDGRNVRKHVDQMRFRVGSDWRDNSVEMNSNANDPLEMRIPRTSEQQESNEVAETKFSGGDLPQHPLLLPIGRTVLVQNLKGKNMRNRFCLRWDVLTGRETGLIFMEFCLFISLISGFWVCVYVNLGKRIVVITISFVWSFSNSNCLLWFKFLVSRATGCCFVYVQYTHSSCCIYSVRTLADSTLPADSGRSKISYTERSIWNCLRGWVLRSPSPSRVVGLLHRGRGEVAVWTGIGSIELWRIISTWTYEDKLPLLLMYRALEILVQILVEMFSKMK